MRVIMRKNLRPGCSVACAGRQPGDQQCHDREDQHQLENSLVIAKEIIRGTADVGAQTTGSVVDHDDNPGQRAQVGCAEILADKDNGQRLSLIHISEPTRPY